MPLPSFKVLSLTDAAANRIKTIIGKADRKRWLSRDEEPDDLLKPYPAELMTMWPVSTKVNSPKNDGPELLDPITLEAQPDENDGSGIERANKAGLNPADSE